MGDIFHFFMAAQEKNLDTCINGFIKNVQKKEVRVTLTSLTCHNTNNKV
jgi:hypothetical protein